MQIKMQGIISARKTSHTTTASVVYGNSPGMRVNTMYINSTRGTASKQDGRQWYIYIYIYICPPFQAHSATQMCTGVRQNQFLFFLFTVCICVFIRSARSHGYVLSGIKIGSVLPSHTVKPLSSLSLFPSVGMFFSLSSALS